MKLYEIFERANKELTQIKGAWGLKTKKTACALGAISYYLIGRCKPYDIDGNPNVEVAKLGELWFHKDGNSLIDRNDYYRWTFKQFAKRARRLGI